MSGLQRALLKAHIVDAVRQQDDFETAVKIARLLDAARHRIVAVFDLDDHDEPVRDSLAYRVDLPVSDGGWDTLCLIHWSRLGLTADDVEFELISVQHQRAEGLHPGGPNDSPPRAWTTTDEP